MCKGIRLPAAGLLQHLINRSVPRIGFVVVDSVVDDRRLDILRKVVPTHGATDCVSCTCDMVNLLPELSRLEVRRCFAHAHPHETILGFRFHDSWDRGTVHI